jgi:DEAD/DEAH box helicase domain-containing protein
MNGPGSQDRGKARRWSATLSGQGRLLFPDDAASRAVSPVPAGTEIVLDLETKVGFDQVRGRAGIPEMGVSVAVTYAYGDDQFRTYREADVPDLLEDLQAASRVIGFNIRRFDFRVLEGYTTYPLERIPILDLLEDIQERIGHRVSLDNLLQHTLGTSKSGDGERAIQWFQDGQWRKLERYCLEDVRATKALYEFGQAQGHVSYWDRRRRRSGRIIVEW